MPLKKLKYRPDIDGLRAIAVLGVVVYHAFPLLLPGGFIGVDIFFVISGYLISGILYKGHREGHFSFKEFYARRVRRLFPALITVLLLCLGYGWIVLLPDEYQQLGKHVASGTLFLQNIVFWKESGYFDIAANLKPMLHLWSLAVEEQFYIFFPPLLVLLWKKPRILIPAMIVLMIVSFIANVVMSYQAVVTDFFLTPYRGWEFLGGSLLAWWHYDKGHEEEVPAYREVLSCSGLLLLALGMALLSKDQSYPGWRALIPVAGTLLLMEGGREAWVNRKVLSHPVMVWVGLISYPLYLFHWPALSFVHIVKGNQVGDLLIWEALGVSLLAAVLTYYLVEKNIRYNKLKKTTLALAALFLLIGICGALIWCGVIKPQSCSVMQTISSVKKDKDLYIGGSFDSEGMYYLNKGGNIRKTLYVGDSNMAMYLPRIIRLIEENPKASRGAIAILHNSCPPIPNFYSECFGKGNKISVVQAMEKELDAEPRIDRVVLGAIWPAYFPYYSKDVNDENLQSTVDGTSTTDPKALEVAIIRLREMMHKINHKNIKIYVVLTAPYDETLNPNRIKERTFAGVKEGVSKLIQTKNQFLEKAGYVNDAIRKVAIESGAEIIDPMNFLCYENKCMSVDSNGFPIRIDDRHLRPGFTKDQVRYLDFTLSE
jgi:peptidoglycan/LPS O-acetylase OafA/YrhL